MVRNYYEGAIWTNHALTRMKQRGMLQEEALLAFKNPDIRKKGKEKDTFELSKRINGKTVTLITKQNEKSEWVILSCWIDPPLEGTKDHKDKIAWRKYKKSGALSRLFYMIKKQLGF